jgi:hypothetical protein
MASVFTCRGFSLCSASGSSMPRHGGRHMSPTAEGKRDRRMRLAYANQRDRNSGNPVRHLRKLAAGRQAGSWLHRSAGR